ncbi:hypothetical protein ES332_A09G010100v1 [Gossypium tomentosum]|uniref:Uncharacterized protein n=1 Tax=Gossypium tomentosum TaxID=34277 RepID=A0A5D2NYQ3_GOSTO|nr:hypothetical protein ES332_A09G010100v1 [Gossypium tomentosum]
MGTGSILEISTITRYPAQAPSMLFFCHVFILSHPVSLAPPLAKEQGTTNLKEAVLLMARTLKA